jgi:hypothetical protein
MGAVPRAKAGVGSAINDATRILGGTLGVAVIGSIYASLYASRLASGLGVHLPGPAVDAANGSVGGALGAADQLAAGGHGDLATTLRAATSAAFFHGFEIACLVAAGVAVAGALVALALLPAHPTARGEETTEPQAPGTPASARGPA